MKCSFSLGKSLHLVCVLTLLRSTLIGEIPHYTEFNNGMASENVSWLDSRGELINAHDGGVFYEHEPKTPFFTGSCFSHGCDCHLGWFSGAHT